MSRLDDVAGTLPFLDAHAVISPRPAAELAPVLEAAVEAGAFDHLHDDQLDIVLRSVKAIVRSGDRWRFRSGSDVGSSETRPPLFGRRSAHDSLSIAEAAVVLSVSDRRARQLAPTLGARVGGVWILDRALVEAERDRRAAS